MTGQQSNPERIVLLLDDSGIYRVGEQPRQATTNLRRAPSNRRGLLLLQPQVPGQEECAKVRNPGQHRPRAAGHCRLPG